VTLVPQEPWLWSGTIAENIGYGLTGAGRAEIAAAAERAGVAGFAAEFAAGLDTPVGEHGRQLSVGQRRRVAIARALLRDTPVLLLDEPTAGLDQATEDRLVRELLASTQGKTVLLVTHAEALTRFADRTLRLAAGQVADRPPGPIDDLAADRRVLAGIAS
jgi:ATP-binding cassette subfamily B protein